MLAFKIPETDKSKNTDKSISTVTFTSDDIATLIQNLDPNKAHGHDMLSIRMLKLCGKSICKPLDLIFQSCIKHGEFSTEWKKANVVRFAEKSLDACYIIDCISISSRMN